MAEFTSIGITGRLDSDEAVYSLRRLIRYLESCQIKLFLEEGTASVLPGNTQQVVSREALGRNCDLVIVVGGDGSMLWAASALARYNVPLLGVNQGRLGFLTDITPDRIEQLVGEVLAGKYLMETRFMLGMAVNRNGKVIGSGEALNDVVLHPGQFIRMIEFELYIDDQFVYSQRSDGLIVSTPTGSTAYALSAGGPLVHPRMDAIVLVPMNPHTLSSRSIVVDGSSEIKLVVGEHNTTLPHITCDGHQHVSTEPGDEVHVHKHPWKLHLIHPVNHNFYDTCRSKLGWQSQIPKKHLTKLPH
jgi:NAD+ kinase